MLPQLVLNFCTQVTPCPQLPKSESTAYIVRPEAILLILTPLIKLLYLPPSILLSLNQFSVRTRVRKKGVVSCKQIRSHTIWVPTLCSFVLNISSPRAALKEMPLYGTSDYPASGLPGGGLRWTRS